MSTPEREQQWARDKRVEALERQLAVASEAIRALLDENEQLLRANDALRKMNAQLHGSAA